MSGMRDQTISSFNKYIQSQKEADLGHMRFTLVQFDSVDPHEIIHLGKNIAEVPYLNPETFQPRSTTPLYDAIHHMLELVPRARAPDEEVVFVVLTDGAENASHKHSRSEIFELVKQHRADGWVFVFLGANVDAYAVSSGLGWGTGSTSNYAADGTGMQRAFADLATASTRF